MLTLKNVGYFIIAFVAFIIILPAIGYYLGKLVLLWHELSQGKTTAYLAGIAVTLFGVKVIRY